MQANWIAIRKLRSRAKEPSVRTKGDCRPKDPLRLSPIGPDRPAPGASEGRYAKCLTAARAQRSPEVPAACCRSVWVGCRSCGYHHVKDCCPLGHSNSEEKMIMKGKIVEVAANASKRSPRAVVSAAKFAADHQRGVFGTLKATQASRGVSRLLKNATAPSVQRELRASATSLVCALVRSRKLGLSSAAADKQVARLLRETLQHATNATHLAQKQTPRPSHKLRGVLLGSGILALGYTQWKRRSRSSRPDA